ncbi:Autophagy-related protein 13 [Termitomyces sp. T112]|nr:Autophagy-related protein 13 [Termitomyces sp. T112]
MSSSDTQRAQIMFHLYTKLFNVVGEARNTSPSSAQKLDKWFNMENPDSELLTKDNRELYKAEPPPGLEIQVLLTVPALGHNEVLVHLPPNSSRVRIQPVPRFVLLETFVLDVVPGPPADVPLATIYKHCILLFRSLFTLLRVLPAWKLYKRLRRRVASLGITLRVRSGNDSDVLSLTNAESRTHTFPALPHPMGSFTLSTTYLAHPAFQLDELESLLSSRFLSQDQRPFTPTLARASAASSSSPSPPRQPSSLPRSSLGKLHTGTRAQVLKQPDSSTSSLSPSSSFYTSEAQQPRPRYPFPFKSNTVSSTAFPTVSPSASGHPSSLTTRIPQHERERVASLPHTPDPTSQSHSPAGRTGPIPLHPRQTSLSRPEDPAVSTSTSTSSTSAPGMRKRYSSSFGHRYATPSSPSSPSMPTSSPSTARPAPINTSPRPLSPSPSSPSFPRPIPRRTDSTGGNGRSSIGNRVRTDDEDISAFVQDIDMRKPLVGGRGRECRAESDRDQELVTVLQQQQPKQMSTQSKSGSSTNLEAELSSSEHAHAHPQSPPERQVLTTEAEIDARLSKMNEAFLTSLEGLGSGASGVTGGSGRWRQWARGRQTMSAGSTGWSGMPQGVLVRQGSQEVVGRMEMDGDEGRDAQSGGGLDSGMGIRGVGAGGGGGRFKF